MDYDKLILVIYEYQNLNLGGLRQKANHVLLSLCEKIEQLPLESQNSLLSRLLTEIYDSDSLDFLKQRGNGQLPFPLKQLLSHWLLPRCERHSMPDMRWFYQVFLYDNEYAEIAHQYLQKAFEYYPKDKKVSELVFEKNIETLEFGIHEFPIGFCITDEDANLCIKQCDEIVSLGFISNELLNRYLDVKKCYHKD